MDKYKTPRWLSILVTAAVFFGYWYVNQVDRTDFDEVVAEHVEDEIIHKSSYGYYGFVTYSKNDEIYLGTLEKRGEQWFFLSSTQLQEEGWGFFTDGSTWIYTGLVLESSIKKVFVGDNQVPLFNEGGEFRYWLHVEPNGYNYPIKAVYEDGTEQWIKEK